MQVDLVTLIAQIINFLILVGLLRIFLYGPITRTMDAREQKVADRLRDAEQRKLEAQKEADSYRNQQRQFEHEKQEVMNLAVKEASDRRQELLKEARDQADASKEAWNQALRRQKDGFIREMHQLAGKEVLAVSRQALTDLASADLEQRMVEVFIERLHNLGNQEKEQIRQLIESGKSVLILTAFDLTEDLRQRISHAVGSFLDSAAEIRFKKFTDLICGIELKAGGHRISWNLQAYMSEMEQGLGRAFATPEAF